MKQGPDSPPMQAAKPALAIEQATILEIRKHFSHMHIQETEGDEPKFIITNPNIHQAENRLFKKSMSSNTPTYEPFH